MFSGEFALAAGKVRRIPGRTSFGWSFAEIEKQGGSGRRRCASRS
jgi:hypothetical protein